MKDQTVFHSGWALKGRAFKARRDEMKNQTCHPERRRSSAKRTTFAVEGPCVVFGVSWLPDRNTRSLHAPVDWLCQPTGLVGMTELRARTQ
jgi:hypothetical protein